MKNILISFNIALFYIFINSIKLEAQWIECNLGVEAEINCFAESGQNLCAGTNKGVFLSTDHGLNWISINNGLSDLKINTLTYSGSNLVADVGYGDVFLSKNNGKNWKLEADLRSVRAFCKSGKYLFAASLGGMFRSKNNGLEWEEVNEGLPVDQDVDVIIANAICFSGSKLFAGTTRGVYQSTNNGDSWKTVNKKFSEEIKVLVVSGTNLFAIDVIGDVYRSTNSGGDWEKLEGSLKYSSVDFLFFSGADLFAGSFGGILLTTNNGLN